MWLLIQWVWLLWYLKDVWKDKLFGKGESPTSGMSSVPHGIQ